MRTSVGYLCAKFESRTKKGAAVILAAFTLLGGTPFAADAAETSPQYERVIAIANLFGEESMDTLYSEAVSAPKFRESLGPSNQKVLEQFYASYKSRDFESANNYIRQLIPIYEERNDKYVLDALRAFRWLAYLTLADYDRAVVDAEKDIAHDPKDAFAYPVRIHALLMKACNSSPDVNGDEMTYALDELDKDIGFCLPKQVVGYRYSAALLRCLRGEYPKALAHANVLVDLIPDSASILELRADCWEGMDKDFRNMRGHFERLGQNIGEWRIPDGKEKAIEDLTAAIRIRDTADLHLKRARLEKELYAFKEARADINTAKQMAKTDDERAAIALEMLSLQESEKAAGDDKR